MKVFLYLPLLYFLMIAFSSFEISFLICLFLVSFHCKGQPKFYYYSFNDSFLLCTMASRV